MVHCKAAVRSFKLGPVTEVQAPSQVAGPYEVSLEDWVSLVEGMQINVRKDGKYSMFKFDQDADDSLDFVKGTKNRMPKGLVCEKVLDNFEDISVESSIVVLTDFFKRVGAGIIIGLSMAIVSVWQNIFYRFFIRGYEYISYDSRMRSRTADVEQMSIEDVVVIDIDNTSVGPVEEGGLGRYHNWPHAYHGH